MLNFQTKKTFVYSLGLILCVMISSCRSINSRQTTPDEQIIGNERSGHSLLEIPKNQTYLPKFGEYVTVNFRIISKDSAGNAIAPKMRDIIVNGGSYRNEKCNSESCSIEVLYSESALSPVLSFELSNDPTIIQHGYIVPAEEEFTVLKNTQSIPSGKSHIILTPGSDYRSSWNRPLASVVVKSTKGFNIPPKFDCSPQACIADIDIELTDKASFTWKTPSSTNNSQLHSLEINVVRASISALKTEAVIDGKGTVVKWIPGLDYLSEFGTLASAVEFLNENPLVKLTATDCDVKGVCQAKIDLYGNDQFTVLRYRMTRGSERSGIQTLKLSHQVQVRTEPIAIYSGVSDWQPIRISSGKLKDYYDQSNGKAVSISITAAQHIEFNPPLAENTKDSLFRCDEFGACTALLKYKKMFIRDNPEIQFTIKTTKGTSPEVTRRIYEKEDQFIFNKKNLVILGKSDGQEKQTFSITLGHNQPDGYQSYMPAKRLGISKQETTEITTQVEVIDDVETVKCENNGDCKLEGKFLPIEGYKTIGLSLINEKKKSEKEFIRFINEEDSAFIHMPRTGSSDETDLSPGQDIFIYRIKRNDTNGYEGKNPAKYIRISKLRDLKILEANPANNDINSPEYEIACDIDGDCSVHFQSLGLAPSFHYFLKDDGKGKSETNNRSLKMPVPFASSIQEMIPDGQTEIELHLGSDGGINRVEFLDSDISPKGYLCTGNCYGTVKLSKPLIGDEILNISYVKYLGGIRSNVGNIELKAGPTIKLNPGTILESKNLEKDIYQIVLKSTDLWSSKNANWSFNHKIWITAPSGVEILKTDCSGETSTCTYKVKFSFEESTKTLDFKTATVGFSNLFFLESPFKVIFKKVIN